MPKAKAEEAAHQPTFLVEQLPRHQLVHLPLDDLEIAPGPVTEAPAWLVNSIRAIGLWQPIAAVGPNEQGRYDVRAGRKRTLAARALGHHRIPALVFPPTTPKALVDAAILATNMTRKRSVVDELSAAERLIADGNGLDEISRDLGVDRQSLDKLLVLRGLLPKLRDALERGEMAAGVADRVAKMPASQQEAVLRVLEKRGRVAAIDISGILQAEQGRAAQGELEPTSASAGGGAATTNVTASASAIGPWMTLEANLRHASDMLHRCRVPEGQGQRQIRASIARAIEEIEVTRRSRVQLLVDIEKKALNPPRSFEPTFEPGTAVRFMKKRGTVLRSWMDGTAEMCELHVTDGDREYRTYREAAELERVEA